MAKKTKTPPPDMIIGPPKSAEEIAKEFPEAPKQGDDEELQIPAFLKKQREQPTPLPMTEDVGVNVPLTKRKDLVPHEGPVNPDGLNVVEFYSNEGGRRRHLVVNINAQTLDLLHLPDLESSEASIRDINNQVEAGSAHWFDIPPNLAQRILDKAAQWEFFKFKYDRNLVNAALLKLGVKPLDTPILDAAIAKAKEQGVITEKKPSAAQLAAREKFAGGASGRRAAGPGGLGVVDTIILILNEGGGTVPEIAAKLAARFPERDASGMTATIRTQLNRLPKQGKLKIVKEGDRYRADGAAPAQPMEGVDATNKKTVEAAKKGDHVASIDPQPMPKSDFIEQVHKQKAREREYLEQPVVGKLVKRHSPGSSKKKAKAKSKKKS